MFLSFFPTGMRAQDDYRYVYMFERKASPQASRFTGDYSMCLEYRDGESMFYSEVKYLRDSIQMAGLEAGKEVWEIRDEQASLPKSSENWLIKIDFRKKEYVKVDQFLTSVFESRPAGLTMPAWKVLPGTETVAGYECSMAEAEYLGRKWKVWFTEDIPLNIGPWLLWGTPGLIVKAVDSEDLFHFVLNLIEAPSSLRMDDGLFLYQKAEGEKKDLTVTGIKELEQRMNYFRRNLNAGIQDVFGGEVSVKDQKGNVIQPSVKAYTPLIPDDFFNKR